MNNSLLPLYKTGWLYLLVVFWLACLWAAMTGSFDDISQYNLSLYSQFADITLANLSTVWALVLVQLVLFCGGLALLWRLQSKPSLQQGMWLSCYCALLFYFQYLFSQYQYWLDLTPCLIALVCSNLLIQGYQRENKLFLKVSAQYEPLLLQQLKVLVSHGDEQQINYLLNQLPVNEGMVNGVYQLSQTSAVTSDNDSVLLLTWIEKTGITHHESLKALRAIRQRSLHKKALESTPENLAEDTPRKRSNDFDALATVGDVAQNYIVPKEDKPDVNKINWHSMSTKINEEEQALEKTLVISDDLEELEQTLVLGADKTQPISNVNLANTLAFKHKQFGRYQVEGLLGKGAMGIVYQGIDPMINRHVAIKSLQLSDSVDEVELAKAKQRFFREAETAGSLSHANIVTIYDVGDEGALGYIAMDLLTGAPLSHFIKPDRLLPVPLVYQLMIQITDALEYAHKQNVVHRDIKPGNIIYDDDLQKVTLTDFGIACVNDNSRTSTGVIMGSPYYMSPEQILGKQVDGRSDIFSLGATFYQLLSGCLPFEGDSVVSVVYKISNEKHLAVGKCLDTLPASATRITNKALQKDVTKRYQSMQEFKQALINALKRDFKQAPMI